MQETNDIINNLEKLSRNIRINVLKMVHSGKSSHVASVFSMVDILSVLYGHILNFDKDNPQWKERDRLILSKGHAGAGIYAALAEVGFFPHEKLKTHYLNGSDLSGHVSHLGIKGVEFSTGSLGHGLSVAAGIALAGKINKSQFRVYTIMSDGECDEGSNWEAILFSSHNKLDNLTVVIDRNKYQSIKKTEDTITLEPLSDKWKAFGWDVIEIDGHNFFELIRSFETKNSHAKPLCIIANTIKGKGVSFMENNILWHYRSPQGDEFNNALLELEKKL